MSAPGLTRYKICSPEKCGLTRVRVYIVRCKPVINTVDLVIFACLNFRKFLILGLFTKFRIREFSFFFSSAIMKNNFHDILEIANLCSSRKLKPREY